MAIEGSAGTNSAEVIGAGLVNRHSSSRTVGKPSAVKRTAARSRRSWSQRGPTDGPSRSRGEAFPQAASWLCLNRLGPGFNPAVSLRFELERELLAARLHDPSAAQHVHVVGHDVVEESLVVGDDDGGALRAAHR